MRHVISLSIASVVLGTTAFADSESPRPVPLTRPEMKQSIESVKDRTPRIPLPQLTDEERRVLGDQADDYESVLRHSYLPWVAERRRATSNGGFPSRSRTREQDPKMTLDYALKTELFWIVSRVNNCQYCIGHQESKLLGAGLSEDEIAALDGDWSGHSAAEQAAFAFARKLAYEPYLLADADIESLRPFYNDLQIVEIIVSVARNNVSNRWKEAIGVPQRRDEGGYSRVEDDQKLPRGSYLTPTSPRFADQVSAVAPIAFDSKTGTPTRVTLCTRRVLDSPAEVTQQLAVCRTRGPRLPLIGEAEAREVLGDLAPQGRIPQWMLLLANFPREGTEHVRMISAAESQGELSPLMKAQLAWIIARHDGAWYAAGHARHALLMAGQSDEEIAALDGEWEQFPARERALFVVAKKLAASPVVLTDRDVAEAVVVAGPRDVVEVINYTTSRAFFDRLTEAAGLQLEE